MANQDTPLDPPASISAAELRRRLLASGPPVYGGGAGGPAEHDAPVPARSRLTMPGANGPVAAASLPPVVLDVDIPEVPIPPRSRMMTIDPAAFPASPLGGTATLATDVLATDAPAAPAKSPGREATADDYKRIKQENRELRKLLDEMKQLLQEASDNEQAASARESELSEQLAAQQRQVDELTNQLQEIEAQVASGALTQAPPQPKTRTELEEWADELEREAANLNKARREIDEERKQLREDEESLEKQMREMEVGMARERALLARQETELKRLSSEIQHELELMQRGDASLREQLAKFQRRAADVIHGRNGPGTASSTSLPPAGGRR